MSGATESCLATNTSVTSSGEPGLAGALFKLAKPGIVIAEVMAGLAGMLLASPELPPAEVIFLTMVTIALAAGGAAMLNNVIDAELDRGVPRLAARNRALKAVGTVKALSVGLLLMTGAFLLATLFLNSLTLLLLAAACGSYLLLYTRWLKRCSPWGFLAGAIPGALPPLIGAAAVSGSVAALPLLLGVVIFIWQIPHFLFLALQYSDQYQQAGIPALPVTRGIELTKTLTMSGAITLLPATLAFKLLAPFPPGFIPVTLLAGVLYQLFCYRYLYRTAEYRKGFILSLAYLTTILAALISASIMLM